MVGITDVTHFRLVRHTLCTLMALLSPSGVGKGGGGMAPNEKVRGWGLVWFIGV